MYQKINWAFFFHFQCLQLFIFDSIVFLESELYILLLKYNQNVYGLCVGMHRFDPLFVF